MARLVLMFNKQVIKEYSFLEDSVTVGRNEDNTIAIENLAVLADLAVQWIERDLILS